MLALGFGLMHDIGVHGGIHGDFVPVRSVPGAHTTMNSTATKMLAAEKVMVREDQVLNHC